MHEYLYDDGEPFLLSTSHSQGDSYLHAICNTPVIWWNTNAGFAFAVSIKKRASKFRIRNPIPNYWTVLQ